MFGNYIKIAFRILLRNKAYSLINILGLAIGMACCILILLWVKFELGYDTFHENYDNLYRAYQKQRYTSGQLLRTDNTPGPLGPDLKNEYPEVERYSRLIVPGNWIVRYKDNCYNEWSICFVDSSFLKMFSFPLLRGDPDNALTNPSSIVLTRSNAEKYFGEEDPIGKTISINNQLDFTVTGVLEDIPHNTHLWFIGFLIPFANTEPMMGDAFDRWGRNWPRTYLQLKPGTDPNEFENKMKTVVGRNCDESVSFHIQPLSEVNLYSLEGEPRGMVYIYVFSLIAFFILLIAGINYMNLSTARSDMRAREIGVRKVTGADRFNIMKQYFIESIILSTISSLLAVGMVELFLPIFKILSGTELKLGMFGYDSLISMILAIVVVSGLFSGSYPALFLSSLQPVQVLKGIYRKGPGGKMLRKMLVVFQFCVSIIMIVGTVVIYFQLDFIRNKDLGYDHENLICFYLRGDSSEKYEVLKDQLLAYSGIEDVTSSTKVPTSGGNSTGSFQWEGKDPETSVLINTILVDYNYIEAMHMELVEGRTFRPGREYNETNAEYILNETAIQKMGMESPVGKWFDTGGTRGTIIGVVKDFHFEPLSQKIEPMLIIPDLRSALVAFIRIAPGNVKETIEFIESRWKEINPGLPFEYNFLDDHITGLYEMQKRLGFILESFAVIAIFIACLGLLGLASYTVQRRTKEIGIRKVLGASISGIASLIIREYIYLVLIANIIAWPAAYFIVNEWLKGFEYRIDLGLWSFLLSAAIAMVIAVLTVSVQTIRAAMADPVDSLRYE
jgi:putative ABC transport system permease protein